MYREFLTYQALLMREQGLPENATGQWMTDREQWEEDMERWDSGEDLEAILGDLASLPPIPPGVLVP